MRTDRQQGAGPDGGGSRAAAMRRRQWLLGLGATAVVLAAHLAGWLEGAELRTQDYRTRAVAGPHARVSREIAVVAIDDGAIRTVDDKWPWGREKVALLVREMSRAGADVIAIDVLLSDPQKPYWLKPEPPATEPGEILGDQQLAAAMGEHMSVVLSASFSVTDPLLDGDEPEATTESSFKLALNGVMAAMEADRLLPQLSILEIVDRLASSMLPDRARSQASSPERKLLALRAGQARTLLRQAMRSSLPAPPDGKAWPATRKPKPPTPELADAAAKLGVVSVDMDVDGRLRHIPLVISYRGRLWATLGLSGVAQHWRVPVTAISVEGNDVVVPMPGGRRRLPLTRAALGGRTMDGLHEVTWPRTIAEWRKQFIDADGNDALMSIGRVHEPIRILERVRENAKRTNIAVAAAVDEGLAIVDDEFDTRAQTIADPTSGEEAWRSALWLQRPEWSNAEASARRVARSVEGSENATEAETERGRQAGLLADAIARVRTEIDEGLARVDRVRDDLRMRLNGRICFVGWVATGANADFVSTAIDKKTPGVLVHAAVANAVLTGYARSPGPWWLDVLAIIGLGLAGTWIGIRANVLAGPVSVVVVAAGWTAIASVVLWGRELMIVTVAAPLLAVGVSWLSVLVHRLLVEQRARRRTEERFRSYVSPAVVDILVNNPELNSMAPQKRELTVMFSDVASFTTTAERLGSTRTAELLATYLGAMTDILQGSRATIDKYLGDGIMAFWGAPLDDPAPGHARHACEAVVRMYAELERLNAAGAFGEAGRLDVRVGLAAGDLMVGDFGNPPRNSSYTVIGDAANLASRLEAANKQFGTRALVSGRVRELAGEDGGLVWRPVGRLLVVGKHEPEEVFELVAGAGDHGPRGARTGEWIGLTRGAVEAYYKAEFDECLDGWDRLEREFGPSPLAEAYRRSVQLWRAREWGGAPPGFDGTITLTEK